MWSHGRLSYSRVNASASESKASMAPFRLRHPKGVSTIQLDTESATVQDLLQAIFAISEIPPSAQDRTLYYQRSPSRSPHSTHTHAHTCTQSRQDTHQE